MSEKVTEDRLKKSLLDRDWEDIEKDLNLFDLEVWSEEQETSPVKRRKRTRAIPSKKRNQSSKHVFHRNDQQKYLQRGSISYLRN